MVSRQLHDYINPDKCSYLYQGKDNNADDTFSFNEFNLKDNNKKTILGINIDRKLTFSSHIKALCTKASQKLCALLGIPNYLHQNEKNLLHRSIIKSQFNYCPFVWMFCSRQSINSRNKLQERALRITNDDQKENFQDLTSKYKEYVIHQKKTANAYDKNI